MIGLLDLDWSLSTSTTFLIPNIEIMKLASYYKIEENQFCRLLTFDDTDLNSYEKIYIFSELHQNLELPPSFLRQSNLIFGGSALTKKQYIPFENSLIDFTIPRPSIYKEVLKQKYNDGIKAKVISKVLDNTYYRNYAGESKLPLPAILPNKQLILYDRDFFYHDWKETIQEISDRKVSSIIRLHPIICHTLTEYFETRNFQKLSRANATILELNIPLEDVNYMLNHYKKLFLADIVPSSNTLLYLGGSFATLRQYCRDLMYKLNLLYSFWSQGIMIKLYYNEPELGITNPIEELEKTITTWSNTINLNKRRDKTIYDRIPKTVKNHPISNQYNEIINLFPEIKVLFEQSFNSLKQRGFWRV